MSDQISTFTAVLPIARSTTSQGSLRPVTTVSAAVVQAAPVAFDVEATLDKAERLAAEAAGDRPRGLPGGVRVRLPARARLRRRRRVAHRRGRAWFRRYWESSIDVPGPAVDRLAAIAREHGVHLVIGVIERDGGTLYCTALFFAPDGALLGKHRKLMPTAAERLVWGFGDGSTLPVFDTPLGRLGAVICWENYMPLLRMAMYAKGDPALLRADRRRARHLDREHAPHRLRGPLLRAVGNQFARRGDYPADYPIAVDDPGEVLSRGGW